MKDSACWVKSSTTNPLPLFVVTRIVLVCRNSAILQLALRADVHPETGQPVFTLDHNIQDLGEDNQAKYKAIAEFAAANGVTAYPAGRGIGHQIMIADRGAAQRDDEVGAAGGRKRVAKAGRVVAGDRAQERFGADRPAHGGAEVEVGLALAGMAEPEGEVHRDAGQ